MRLAASGERAWPLYGAAFFTALGLSICWTAMPFVLVAIGGTQAHVGYAPAVNGLAYMVALLVTGSLLGHLEVKRVTRIAILIAFLAAVAMVAIIRVAGGNGDAGGLLWIWLMIVAGGVSGASMALYWPFLMSWVSARYEGKELNRRFGRYNGSWSGGGVIGPFVGARLVEIDVFWPMVTSVGCFMLVFFLLGLARNDAEPVKTSEQPPDTPAAILHDRRLLGDYRWMSRVALFCAWAVYSIDRSQFALVFTERLGFAKWQFGIFLTSFALCNFLTLVGAGRWAFWHFKVGGLLGAQVLLLISTLMVIYGRTLVVFYLASIILGLAFGFAYSSHLYYGASASRRRSMRMAIHELVISLGIAIGSGTGGYLAKNVGDYAPYWFAIVLVGLGGVLQLAIHFTSRLLAGRQERKEAR